jgi:putative transposase
MESWHVQAGIPKGSASGRFGSLGVPEIRELRQLRDENRKLKQLVADLSLDKTILQESLRKRW